MDYHDQIRFGAIEPFTPEEEKEEFARKAGQHYGMGLEGCEGEITSYLESEDYVRRAFLYSYHYAFVDRKFQDGEITEESYDYYDPFWPKSWNYGLEWTEKGLRR